MALFRKDLKVGFAIGAVALVGGTAYLLFGGGDKMAATDDPFATADPLAVRPADPTPPANPPVASSGSPVPSNMLAKAGSVPSQSWDDALAGRQPVVTQTPNAVPDDATAFTATPNLNEELRGAFRDLASEAAGDGDSARAATPVPTSLAPPSAAGATVHEIEAGENFSTLAKKYLGDGNLYLLVAAANPGVDSSRLKLGQKVNIPGKAAVEAAKSKSAPAKVAATSSSAPADSGYTHVVSGNDTLYSIAEKRLGRAALWKDIYALNKAAIGDDPERLPVGLTLRLPK